MALYQGEIALALYFTSNQPPPRNPKLSQPCRMLDTIHQHNVKSISPIFMNNFLRLILNLPTETYTVYVRKI